MVMKIFVFLLSAFGLWGLMYGLFRVFQKSEHPVRLGVKLAVSAALISAAYDLANAGGLAIIAAIVAIAPLTLIWTGDITELVGRRAVGIYTGGKTEMEQEALLSSVQALKSSGQYQEALKVAKKELDRYPDDFDCILLIASVHAEGFRDVPLATRMLKSLLSRPETGDKQIAHALSTLADWQLNISRNPAAATATLRQISGKFPGSRAAHSAENRIAHMPGRAELEARDRPKEGKVMPKFERDLGLKKKAGPVIKEVDADKITDEFLAYLNQHPNDWDAREQLAHHYIEHYDGVEQAALQFEELIASKFANKADKCRWLHQIANWHAKVGDDTPAARATLERIVEMYPGSAYAEQAERAMHYLRG